MKPLTMDWRVGAAAVRTQVPSQQQTLVFKQKKTLSTSKKNMLAADNSAVLPPVVVYDLSDSDGTSVSLRPGRAMIGTAKPSVELGVRKNDAEVVDLGSDSEDDSYGAAKSKFASLGHGGTAGAGSKAVSAIVLDSPDVVPRLNIVGKSYDHSLPTSLFCNSGGPGDIAECPKSTPSRGLMGKRSQILGRPLEEDKSLAGEVPMQDLTTDDNCDLEPEWLRNHKPAVSWGLRVAECCNTEKWLPPNLGDSRGICDTGDLMGKRKFDPVAYKHYMNSDSIVDENSNGAKESMPEIGKSKCARIQKSPILTEEMQERPIDYACNLGDTGNCDKKNSKGRKGRVSEEEPADREAQKQRDKTLRKARQEEEKRLRDEKKEEMKRQKEAAKVEAAEKRKLDKEADRWKKGKFALKNTTAYLDTTVIEMKNLGPLILGLLGEKGYNYKVAPNPIQRTIIWKMKQPTADVQADTDVLGFQNEYVVNSSQISNSQLALEDVEVKYVVAVFQGEEFATMVAERRLQEHICRIQDQYPGYRICYLVNGLMKYIKRKEQHHYKIGDGSWKRPNVEQALAELVTHYVGVHSRLCIDESEMADHVVGLMRSLSVCPFKQKLTSLSVHANGDHVTKSDPNRTIIMKNTWLKVLVAIPHICGAIAIAIAREYPTMRSLLKVYLDPLKAVHEKEFLLADITREAVLGSIHEEGRRVGPVASKRIYRVLMAQDGNLMTEDVEGPEQFASST